ncbi:MAG: ABC transporter ATP-binding protein [Candidatus Bipolaricaulota bacterium]|nr:ABC transporter ATP-binding protein [Candidatus Bipolaricaulota bacterium]
MSLLSVNNLSAGYGEVDVLHGVLLNIEEGELVSTIGPNGAGKSTLLRSISGVLTPEGGKLKLDETDITGFNPEDTIRMGMSYVPQDDNIFPSLTVRENLEMGAFTLEGDFEDRIDEICNIFPQLRERMGQKAGTMSGGQQQMVAVGRGLLIRPKLLLLDEPTAGLQPSLVNMMLNKVEEINERGVTVLLVAQTIDALRLANRGYLLSAGEMILSGETEELLETERVRDLYFGGQQGE